jgi:hypothetical protein
MLVEINICDLVLLRERSEFMGIALRKLTVGRVFELFWLKALHRGRAGEEVILSLLKKYR